MLSKFFSVPAKALKALKQVLTVLEPKLVAGTGRSKKAEAQSLRFSLVRPYV
jgi:hypothetical protein